MSAAASELFPQDRNLDWLDELDRVVAAAESLTPPARRAVLEVVASIAREDGELPQAAVRSLAALGEPRVETEARPDRLRALRLRLVSVA